MKYKLLYQNIELGEVILKNSDFPNLSGSYHIDSNAINQIPLLKEYIDYSIQADQLMKTDQESWVKFMTQEEWKYHEIIDSEAWVLIDDKGASHQIMIPNFCDQHEIVWRWL